MLRAPDCSPPPDYLRLIFKQMPVAVWATDRDLRVTYVHGHPPMLGDDGSKPLVGTTVRDRVRAGDGSEPAVAHHLAALAGARDSFQCQRGGRSFDVLVEPLRDLSGAIIGCVGSAVDVTERLIRSEAHLAEAQRVAHIGSFELNLREGLVNWSDELRRIYGAAEAAPSVTVDAFFSRVLDEDKSHVLAVIFDACRRQTAFAYNHRITRASGEVRVLHTVGEVVPIRHGEAFRVVGSCWDVTAQDETVRQLRRAISQLQATLDATADGILVVDREGRISARNRRFHTVWRIPPQVADQSDDHALRAFVANRLADPGTFLDGLENLDASPTLEVFDMVHLQDGRVVERHSLPQLVDGDIVGRVWSFRDVSERERLLSRATFLADASRLLLSLDIEQALAALAKAAVPYLGDHCAIDLIDVGEPRRAGDPGDADSRAPERRADVLTGRPTIYQTGARSCMAAPLICRDQVVGAITCEAPVGRKYSLSDLDVLVDLAQRIALSIDNARLYAATKNALSSREEFIAIAAHEIRGPLTSIHLAVGALLGGAEVPPKVRLALEVIQREDRRLGRFVEELLDMRRIGADQLHLELADVDLGSVVRDVVSRLSQQEREVGSTIELTAEGSLVGRWDRFRLDQVVTNLLDNAIKYGEGKPIQVHARRSGWRAILTVVDHGIGMAPHLQASIFDRYQRAPDTRHYGGLGLGLHIAKMIVAGLGGTIAVDSRPDEGSTFTVILPIARRAS